MYQSLKPLPAGWTIRLHRVLNLTILTLHDPDGTSREVGFCPLTPDGPQESTVTALADIPESELRKAAQSLIDTLYDRTCTAEAQRNFDAFAQAFPDLQALLTRLQTQLPECRTDLGINSDGDEPVCVLTLTAAHSSAGPSTPCSPTGPKPPATALATASANTSTPPAR